MSLAVFWTVSVAVCQLAYESLENSKATFQLQPFSGTSAFTFLRLIMSSRETLTYGAVISTVPYMNCP
jgi:hypothetical protein